MKPSLGRIVHFVDFRGDHRAAIITNVNDDGKVNLAVFDSFGTVIVGTCRIPYDEKAARETWHWPEREE